MAVLTLFGQAATGSALAADATGYTMAVQFSVSSSGVASANVTGMWFYSPPGAVTLPQRILIYTAPGRVVVANQLASWSGAAGSGWVRAPFTVPPALTLGSSYKAAMAQTNLVNWYSATGAYWSTGPGAAGVTNGALTAVNNAGGDGGQDTFTTLVPSYPDTSFNASNYWVDPEVTTVPAPGGGAPDRHHHRTPSGRPGQARNGGRGGVR